jgi:glycosyltransferase involved in cell wall biosynthesis
MDSTQSIVQEINGCVIIPTYNNERTLMRVIDGVLKYIPAERMIIVNDGSTDSTNELLATIDPKILLLKNEQNAGKGTALRKGFAGAITRGFDYAVTIDSDGQHFPEDLISLLNACKNNPGAMIMGSRNMNQENVPQKSSFGNKFSNFWFKIETWIDLPDTQTGYRIYPLGPLSKMRLFTRKFELEIEVIVRLAWKGVKFIPVPVNVKYDPEERVSHFRPGRDFFRISVLNSVLVTIALLYYYPKRFFSIRTLHAIRSEAIKPDESNLSKALSLGFGVFMGIVPLWGFQLLIGIPLSVLFRMNKVLFITAANISVPPMIPLIVFVSLLVGQFSTQGSIDMNQAWNFSGEAMKENATQYIVGAFVLAALAFISVFSLSFLLLSLFRRKKVKDNS